MQHINEDVAYVLQSLGQSHYTGNCPVGWKIAAALQTWRRDRTESCRQRDESLSRFASMQLICREWCCPRIPAYQAEISSLVTALSCIYVAGVRFVERIAEEAEMLCS
jgi:hypothetical protein